MSLETRADVIFKTVLALPNSWIGPAISVHSAMASTLWEDAFGGLVNGKLTCFVLGAGASRDYARGPENTPMPLQSDLLGELFMGLSSTGGVSMGAFNLDGLRHSERLARKLREVYQLPAKSDDSWLEYWRQLQQRFNLETLYNDLETRLIPEDNWAIKEFEAIVRTRVGSAVNRSSQGVCDNHARLVRQLEPGDYIINFNWDTIASDALYYRSRLWHPSHGFGLSYPVNVISNEPQDRALSESGVELYHIHGGVHLFEVLGEQERVRGFAYLAPESYDSNSSMIQNLRISDTALRQGTEIEMERWHLNWILMPHGGPWLRPIFLPPSSRKVQYSARYSKLVRMSIQRQMPTTQRFVVIGYSVPPADRAHLAEFFLSDVIAQNDPELIVVNPECESTQYLERVRAWLPTNQEVQRFHTFSDYLSSCEAAGRVADFHSPDNS